jgi:DNA-binding transcriptional ArsR family regulator
MAKISRAEKELIEFDKIFKALAHPTRRYILTVLLAKGDRMKAGDIVSRLSDKWPTITRHLKKLVDADIIKVEKQGVQQIYYFDKKHMNSVLKKWIQLF